jgi:CheY-like chemotaxis protein
MPKILIVDDEPVVHMLYKRHLTQAGFELLDANNGDEALALLQETKPDVILMDIMMPSKDGIATLREVKRSESTSHIPVIVITANVSYYLTSRDEVKNGGADALLTKPCSPAKVVAEVLRILAAKAAA